MKVLVVDDDHDIRNLLKVILLASGHEVVDCYDAHSAYEICKKESFSLIVLDWELGEMSGIALCRRIRNLPHGQQSVILMFTGRNSPEDLQIIMEAGADDYLSKPVDAKLLKVRIRISESQAENKTARIKAEQQLAETRAKEIDIGSKIQQDLLLGSPPQNFAGLQMFAHSIPSQKIDGDFYDFYEHNDDCIDMVVGDVMGKGIAAALLGAAVKSRLLHAINRLKTKTLGKPPQTCDILSIVQSSMTDHLIELGKFVTLCYARFILSEQRLVFVCCGHTRTLHYHCETGTCELISGENLPIGIIYDETYQEITVEYTPGDIILFYSDGITEARNNTGVLYGEKLLSKFIKQNHQLELEQLVNSLNKDVERFAKINASNDDRTCVAIRIEDKCVDFSHADVLEITSGKGELHKIRDFSKDYCIKQFGDSIDPMILNRMILAVNEASSNIMRHAYNNQSGCPIRITACKKVNCMEFNLIHEGSPFTPPKLDPKRLSEPKPGGMGLYIINDVMDEVNYINEENGKNRIQLLKYIKE